MRNPWLVLFSFLVIFQGGCADRAKFSIDPTSEFLEEGHFEIRYPSDWKITTETYYPDSDFNKTLLTLHHPKNKACQLTIKILDLKSPSEMQSLLSRIMPQEIRELQITFEKDGYKDFSFRTTKKDFSGEPATQVLATAGKSTKDREATMVIIPYKNMIYILTYQGFSFWPPEVKSRLKETLYSFRFVR